MSSAATLLNAELPSSSRLPFVIPLAVESLYPSVAASEVVLRRFMASIDEEYLVQRGLPLSYLAASHHAALGKGIGAANANNADDKAIGGGNDEGGNGLVPDHFTKPEGAVDGGEGAVKTEGGGEIDLHQNLGGETAFPNDDADAAAANDASAEDDADDEIAKANAMGTSKIDALLATPHNEITASLRDHARTSLTPSILRMGYLLTHLFNVRYCRIVEALHLSRNTANTTADSDQHPPPPPAQRRSHSGSKSFGSGASASSASPQRGGGGGIGATNKRDDASMIDMDGPARQETCKTSSTWLEDLQLCTAHALEEHTTATAADEDNAQSPPSSSHDVSELNTNKSNHSNTTKAQEAEVAALNQSYLVFGPHSWFRMLPAGLMLASKLSHVMIRRHVMRFCILDNCQRVAGTNVTVPAPCAWEVQLQSYEIAMVELIASQRLADRRLPEGYLRVLLWQFQHFAGECMSNKKATEAMQAINLFSPSSFKELIRFPLHGVFVVPPSAPQPKQTGSLPTLPRLPSLSSSSSAAPNPKLSPSFRECVQTGALAILSFCYRSTELLLYGAETIVAGREEAEREDVLSSPPECPKAAEKKKVWAASSQKGSMRVGLISGFTGEGVTFDVAVMALMASISTALHHNYGASLEEVTTIRRAFWKAFLEEYSIENIEKYEAAREASLAAAAMMNRTPSSSTPTPPLSATDAVSAASKPLPPLCPPPTVDVLEAYFHRFISLFDQCLNHDDTVKRDASLTQSTGMYEYLQRVCRLMLLSPAQ